MFLRKTIRFLTLTCVVMGGMTSGGWAEKRTKKEREFNAVAEILNTSECEAGERVKIDGKWPEKSQFCTARVSQRAICDMSSLGMSHYIGDRIFIHKNLLKKEGGKYKPIYIKKVSGTPVHVTDATIDEFKRDRNAVTEIQTKEQHEHFTKKYSEIKKKYRDLDRELAKKTFVKNPDEAVHRLHALSQNGQALFYVVMTEVTQSDDANDRETVHAKIIDVLGKNPIDSKGIKALNGTIVTLDPENMCLSKPDNKKSAKVRWKKWHKHVYAKKVEVVLAVADKKLKVFSWREISGPTLLVRKVKDALMLKRGKHRTVHKDHTPYLTAWGPLLLALFLSPSPQMQPQPAG